MPLSSSVVVDLLRLFCLCSPVPSRQCTIRSSRFDLSYTVVLKYTCSKYMQMSLVDVFAVGGAGELDWWEEIATKALSLDRDDFLPTGYKVSAKFKTVATTSPQSRARVHPSD